MNPSLVPNCRETDNPRVICPGLESSRVPNRAIETAEDSRRREFSRSTTPTRSKLKTTVAQQQKQIEALTATVQKVSDQVALSKPAPQLVANP
jgi:hypothetical protein